MARRAHTILAVAVLILALAGTVRCKDADQDFQAEDEDAEQMHKRNAEAYPDEDPKKIEKEAAEMVLDETDCEVGKWGLWSECTSACGKGTMTRTRRLMVPANAKACDWVDTVQTRNCNEHNCSEEELEHMRTQGTYQTIINIVAIGGGMLIVVGCIVYNLPKRKY